MSSQSREEMIENALRNAYQTRVVEPNIPDSWQAGVMSAVKSGADSSDVALELEDAASTFLRIACVAAEIAAIVVIVFCVFSFTTRATSIEDDIQNLYADNSLNDSFTEMFGSELELK